MCDQNKFNSFRCVWVAQRNQNQRQGIIIKSIIHRESERDRLDYKEDNHNKRGDIVLQIRRENEMHNN